jgi:hypothetical protein
MKRFQAHIITNQNDLATKDRSTAGNSTYKKLAVQWLNEALCFVSSSVVADSFRLRNRQLLVAATRWAQLKKQIRIYENNSIS